MLPALLHAIRRSIALKLTLTLIGFVGISLIAAGIYLNQALETFAVEALEARLATAARLLMEDARGLVARRAGPDAVRAFAVRASEPSGSRITLIALDGRVLGDSDVLTAALPQVENHAGRPEVRAALAGHVGRHLRRSVTIDQPLLYVALPVRDGDQITAVLRLALPLSAVTASYRAIHRVMLIGGLVALLVALGIGMFVAGRVTDPVVQMQTIAREMSEGNFAARAPVRSPDEIGVLARAINTLAQRLRDRLADLQHERAKIGAILDGMVEGVLAVDGRGHVVLMNERARTMFGLQTARPEGTPLLEVVRHVGLHELVGRCRLSGEGTVVRRELRVAGPFERTVQANAVPLRLAADDPGVVMVLHDVTELRRLEQVRTEFVANVSHELRTPLTAIHGYLETLLSGALEDRDHARRFLEIVFRHTERLGRLLNDLTDLSNIELGRVILKIEPTRVDEVIESVLAIIKPRADSGGVTLTADLPGPLPVQADRDRLAQILINLVDNAVKYTPRGGRVTVRARPVAAARVAIAIEDTGVGIPAEDLPRITERFYRVDKARSRELGGTGLGLAIVKHLVAAHGGQLEIESEVERGTIVRVTLPAGEVR